VDSQEFTFVNTNEFQNSITQNEGLAHFRFAAIIENINIQYGGYMKFIIRLAIVFSIIITTVVLVSANHSFSVYDAQLCLNGSTFKGSPVTPQSFTMQMVGQIFDNSFTLVASGTIHVFRDYDSAIFTVTYPEGTFNVGDFVIYSVSDVPGSGNGTNGADEGGYIQDCYISVEASPLDNRINRYDAAAPIAVYFVNGTLEVWSINSASEGTLVMSFSQSELDAAGAGLIESSGSIQFFKLEAGGYLFRVGMSNGKTYVLSFSELTENAAYSSYEE
jgi:hypothetical protein